MGGDWGIPSGPEMFYSHEDEVRAREARAREAKEEHQEKGEEPVYAGEYPSDRKYT